MVRSDDPCLSESSDSCMETSPEYSLDFTSYEVLVTLPVSVSVVRLLDLSELFIRNS